MIVFNWVICRVSEADTKFDTTIGHIEDIIMGMCYVLCESYFNDDCMHSCSLIYLEALSSYSKCVLFDHGQKSRETGSRPE